MKFYFKNIIFTTLAVLMSLGSTVDSADNIVGYWLSEKRDLKVEVYRYSGNKYAGRIVWFSVPKGREMVQYKDKENPNAKLRTRPWLGMIVMHNLSYKGNNEWNNGDIYDPNSGNTFDSSVRLEGSNLTVRGFWKFEVLGKNMRFVRSAK